MEYSCSRVVFVLFEALIYLLGIFKLSNAKLCDDLKMCNFSIREVFPCARSYLSVPMQLELSLNFHRKKYMGTWTKFAKHSEGIESESRHMFYTIDLSALLSFLAKINDRSRCIGTERYICTTI